MPLGTHFRTDEEAEAPGQIRTSQLVAYYWPTQWFSSLAAHWYPPGTLTNTYAGTPLQTHHVRLLGKGAGIGIYKSSRVTAMMVRGAWRPLWWAAQAGDADFPG